MVHNEFPVDHPPDLTTVMTTAAIQGTHASKLTASVDTETPFIRQDSAKVMAGLDEERIGFSARCKDCYFHCHCDDDSTALYVKIKGTNRNPN